LYKTIPAAVSASKIIPTLNRIFEGERFTGLRTKTV